MKSPEYRKNDFLGVSATPSDKTFFHAKVVAYRDLAHQSRSSRTDSPPPITSGAGSVPGGGSR